MTGFAYWARPGSRFTRRGMLRGIAVGGAGLTAAALIGCSSKSGAPAPATSKDASPAASKAGKTPRAGGRLAVTGALPPTWDFTREVTAGVPGVMSVAFNGLVKFDPLVNEQDYRSVVPDLAEKWEIAPDGQTYTFFLVKNAKFHDGTPFTAADVKASYERQQRPPAGAVLPRGAQLRVVNSFEVPDPYTLKMKLSRPVSPLTLLPILSQFWMSVYSQKDITGNVDFRKNVNGTGPFRHVSFDDTKITYDKNKNYHVKDRPYLDGVDFYNLPDAASVAAQVQNGAINIASIANYQPFQDLKSRLGDRAQYQSPLIQTVSCVIMNSRHPMFADERVRRAVTLAYDKVDAIKVLNGGQAELGGYMYPHGPWALSRDELAKVPGYEPYSDAGLAEAKKLVAAAGIKPGTPVQILTRKGTTSSSVGEQHSLYFADQLKKLDMKGNLDIVTTATEYDRANSGTFDSYVLGLGFFVDDPDSVYPDHFLTDSPLNYNKLGSKQVDDAFLKQSVELDPKKRVEMVKNLEKLALPYLSKLTLRFTMNNVITQKTNDFLWSNHQSSNARMEGVWLDA